jgi:rhodanese-related sulfurtransferase
LVFLKVAGACASPAEARALIEKTPGLDKAGPYLVYFHSHISSRTGAQKLPDSGIKNAYRLAGNHEARVAAGYPVDKP